ncbi:YlxQ family RNA-binding protein [Listeria monocytogenes]|nr:YlxQ family RNA-binding protein [Listeria monocytogenes]
MDKKALSLLGLANRARKITTGEELVLKAVRNGKAKMVLISEDISEKTEKIIRNKCEYYNVVVKKAGTREMIGGAIGKDTRAIVAILDKGFAVKLAELLG